MMTLEFDPPLWLASRSPRRWMLLQDAGIRAVVRPAEIDDGDLRPGQVAARDWVIALAWLKARWVADAIKRETARAAGTVLAADTVCVHDGAILGKPASAEHAREMIAGMRNVVHETVTGVCVLRLPAGPRRFFADAARVTIGDVSDVELDAYLASGAWRDKAGGYNLQDRIDAGWPIRCEGDPATVMGLPMNRLATWLESIRNADA